MKRIHTMDDDDTFDDLIGQALGLIDESPTAALALFSPSRRAPAASPEQVARVRSQLDFLLDDGMDPVEPDIFSPSDKLIERTKNRIREYEAMQAEFREPFVYRPRWRVADLAVAAAVLFAMFLGSMPAIKNSHIAAANVACSGNLSQIWKGVEQYATTFGYYPNAAADDPRLPVGATLSLLIHTGHLDESVPLTCPGCVSALHARSLPRWERLREQSDVMVREFQSMMTEVYAMHPGLKHSEGVSRLERSMVQSLSAMIPLVGDRPPMNGEDRVCEGNSPAHGGFGQNMIFADGHSAFIRSRSLRAQDSDVYANRYGSCEAAAADAGDIVLVPARTILNIR